MDLHSLFALAFLAGLLSAAFLSFACLRLLPRCRLTLLGRCRCRNPHDLELGPAAVRVGPEIEPDSSKKDPAVPRRFAWEELESHAGSLKQAAVVGEGGFSTVYLVRLFSSVFAAVKIHRPSERLRRAFRQELDVLLRLRHPHVVRLLGYCDDGEQGALVFEYVPNGSLHEKLHGRSAGDPLPWARRMAIAYQIAQALEYLHEACDPQIVHGDVTASNVLLDDRLEPKLCDFGSARLGFSAAVQPLSTSGRSASRQMMGSPGYVDPHYLRSGMISKKSDVYSFGILLLELVTGVEAYDTEREQHMLAAAMRPLLEEAADDQGRRRALDAVDGSLNGEYDAEEAAAAMEAAAMCVGENHALRPSMAELVRILGKKMSSSISTLRTESDGAKVM